MYLLHDGVLKPLEALGLREQQRVRITVEEVERAAPPSAASREAAQAIPCRGAQVAVQVNRSAGPSADAPTRNPTPAVLHRARRLTDERQIHFWDAMIYAACQEARVDIIFSEDLPSGQVHGLEVVNPFA